MCFSVCLTRTDAHVEARPEGTMVRPPFCYTRHRVQTGCREQRKQAVLARGFTGKSGNHRPRVKIFTMPVDVFAHLDATRTSPTCGAGALKRYRLSIVQKLLSRQLSKQLYCLDGGISFFECFKSPAFHSCQELFELSNDRLLRLNESGTKNFKWLGYVATPQRCGLLRGTSSILSI